MNLIFDIEANGLDPTKIFCIVALDVDTKTVHSFGEPCVQAGLDLLQRADKLIGHNIIGYDIPAIKKVTGIDLSDKKIVDTLVLSRLFKPTREGGHGLESWGYRLNYAKGDYGQSEGAWEEYTEDMLHYCENDVKLNYKVYNALKFESKGFSARSVILEHEVAKIINDQRNNGFLLDQELVMKLVALFEEKLEDIETKVQDQFRPKVSVKELYPQFTKSGELSKLARDQDGKGVRLSDLEYQELKDDPESTVFRETVVEFNLGSRKQIGEYLMDFGWKPKKYTPTGQPIVDEGTLSKIKDIPEAQLIAEYLMIQKRLAQVNSWLKEISESGRVHGYVNPNGAVTGRMTHSHPNMAQVPSINSPYGKECRSCWTVPDNHKLIGIDASGLELRMLAHYLNDEEYTNEILNGDIHTFNQKLGGLESRNQAKTFIYALLYGAGDAKLGQVVGRGREIGKGLRKQFFDNLPSFKSLSTSVQRKGSSGFLKGLDGRKIIVRSAHASLNTLLQSAGSIVMKQAVVFFNDEINRNKLRAKFVANVHDEWQVECHEDDAHAVGEAGVRAIKEAGELFKLNCPLDGEYQIGLNWSETH
jgi:DNA polymerase I-like protein with 3'-5' exonuclease and polymerase domains|tara:strand:+ start:4849 stop:6612 length:1764 start_codon:yes stop_codon:yes gene_type:complete